MSTKVIGCSEEVAEVLRSRDRLPGDRVVAIRNGIDLRRFQAISGEGVRTEFRIASDRVLIAIVGRLSPAKAHQDLFLAFARIAPEIRRKFVCLVVGEGDLRSLLEAEVKRLDLDDNVIFTGLRRDVPRLLKTIDLFVMSSRWEGLPIALLEAMACGVAPLSTSVGGIPGVIEDGVNGALVESGDIAAMAEQLERLIASPELRTRLGARAKEDVLRCYDVQRTAEAYDALYFAALGGEAEAASIPRAM
jgi:glycosyltransferase involved in cell wall biosynthesis